uniref:Cytochrome b n=1 Tax=Panagrolaimus sp. PS1159 TaxID=55785 RepID=A0AC35GRN4_9BILA
MVFLLNYQILLNYINFYLELFLVFLNIPLSFSFFLKIFMLGLAVDIFGFLILFLLIIMVLSSLIYKKYSFEAVKNYKVLKQLVYFINSLLVSLPRSIVLVFQIITGTLLAIYYSADSLLAFNRVQYIIYELSFKVCLGFWFDYFFVCYNRGFYRLCFSLSPDKFLGFCSYYYGFTVSGATLKFFFVLHFLVPYLVLVVMLVHLIFLHTTGRTSKLFCHGDYDKIRFFPYY